MDPSVCRLHPGVAVTGFCPACLRDRLAGLQPPSSADLRRCKSFSYARSAASLLEPQRRSCDLFRQDQQQPGSIMAVPEQEEEERRTMEPSRKSSFGGLLGKKLQQWRRKKKEMPMPSRHRQHSYRGEQLGVDSRRSCDLGSASWDAQSGPMFDRLGPAAAMLSMAEEDSMPSVPRSDGQIPVEEDYFYHDNTGTAVPGGCAQTRDYYLDSSSSGRRRRSVDRSTTSGRNSFSDVNSNELPTRMTANARVSPAIAAEFYHAHHQSLLVHHHRQYRRRDWDQAGPTNYINNLRRDDDDFSGSFGSAFRANKGTHNKPANNKKGIKGWSIWGLIHKKSSSRKPEADHRSLFSSSPPGVVIGEQQVQYPWPELRARGYNGQMLRCNSSISARSSFSGGAAMIGGSARRSISGVENQHDVNGGHGSGSRTRRDDILLERTLSSGSSYSRSGHDNPMGAANYQFNHNGVRSSKSKPSAMPRTRRSTLGPYSTDPIIPRQL